MKLLLATTNKGKIREFEPLIGPKVKLLSATDPSFGGRPVPDVVEDGGTYFENALKKAMEFYRTFRTPVLADDSGLEIDVLDGAPGIFSARYGGESLAWAERWDVVYRALTNFPKDKWSARFRCVLCYYSGPGDVPQFFEGTVEGQIVPRPRGEKGFGYDPIFYSNQLGKTFGESTPAEKDLVSHRSQAILKFLASGALDQA